MDATSQIQGIKLHLDSMKMQIENIEMQNNNNVMNPMMMNPIGDQLLTLSIQMVNIGIQSIKFGKNLVMNFDKYFLELNKISENINMIIQMYNNEKMMGQQVIQQQMQFQNMMQQQILNKKKVNAVFREINGKKTNIIMHDDASIKELLDKYMEEVYGFENNNIYFLVNADRLGRYDNTKIKNCPNLNYIGQVLPLINVLKIN